MLKVKFCFIFLLSVLLLEGVALYSKPSATMGRHFIIGFMQNEIHRTDLTQTFYQSIFVSTLKADTVFVKFPDREIAYPLKADTIIEINVSSGLEVTDIGVNKSKLIDISCKSPMVVWAYSSKNQSSDSYVAMPVSIWGNQYRVISVGNDMYSGTQRLYVDGCTDASGKIINPTKYNEQMSPRASEFLIMASLDNTEIEYYPTCNTKNGISAGQKGTIKLHAGECFLVQGAGGDVGTNDLTGTLINSNNPIGVLSGHVRTSMKQGLDHPYDTKDHLLEMLPPVKSWGKHFVSVPFVNGQNVSTDNYGALCESGDLIKVIAAEDNTKIIYEVQNSDTTLISYNTTIKKAGDCFEMEARSPIIWTSDKPVMISQFMMHKGHDGESFNYDPALVILTPVEQYVTRTNFSAPNNTNIYNQYVAHCYILITDSSGIDYLTHNSANMNENSATIWKKQIGNSKYYWLMNVYKQGSHQVIARQGSFSGIIYGHGLRDSYAMTLGSRFNDPYNVDTISPIIIVDSSCGVFNIKITDIKKDDTNATGIDWIEVKNVVNYNIQKFTISDTATIIDIVATPIDTTKDGKFSIEIIDKSYNIVTRDFFYTGFNVERPTKHDFGMLNWTSPTEATLHFKNNSNGTIRLQSIENTDARITATDYTLPKNIYTNETFSVKITFTPDETLTPLDATIILVFDCYKIGVPLIGNISAPGLLADNLDFGKVRLYDKKTLKGKIYNAGNIQVRINDVKKDIEETSFIWNFNKPIQNYNLAIGDSINYSVDFIPSEERQYIVNSNIENNNNIVRNFYVKGIGCRPKIENIILDWGKRRIGTKNDTTIYIINTGSFGDTINYKSNISISHSADLSIDSIKKINEIIIDEQDKIIANYSFVPINTIPLENKFALQSNWNYHPQITATFIGQGTIPEYEGYDCDFGNVPIFSNKDTIHKCIYSFGNEALTIDSIVLIGGDINSFVINYNALYNLIIEPNEYLEMPITFKPTEKGMHKIFLEITHDAHPNYLRGKDTIEIYGICLTENTDLIVNLDVPLIYSCITEEATLTIENIGEASIIIDSVLLFGYPDVFSFSFANNLQNTQSIELKHNDKISFPINIYAEREKNGTLIAEVFYNDENKIVVSEPIEPITYTIRNTIHNISIPKNSLMPNDTLFLYFETYIHKESEKNFEYVINLHLPKKMLFCLEEKCMIGITGSTLNGVKYSVDIKQHEDRIEFSLPTDFFEIDRITTIAFELPFLILLAL